MTTLELTLFSASPQSGYQLDFTGTANAFKAVGLTAKKPDSNLFELVRVYNTGADGKFSFRVAYPPSVKGQIWEFRTMEQNSVNTLSQTIVYMFPEFDAAPPPPGDPPVPAVVGPCLCRMAHMPAKGQVFLRKKVRVFMPKWATFLYYLASKAVFEILH